MKNRILFILWLASFQAFAHPAIGIVKDSKDNIYYTDLSKILKISENHSTTVVTNVHSHELFMDTKDNLFGEHLWYAGEKTNKWFFYHWTRRSDGSFAKLSQNTEGFDRPFSFVRDSMGNQYFNRKWKDGFEFYRRKPDATIEVLGQAKFNDIRWMHCTEGGVLYFIDLDKIYKIQNGQFRLLATDLIEKTPEFSWVDKRMSLYGLWTDTDENLYVAVLSGQKIKKIAKNGTVSTIYTASKNWSPIGGLFDSKGHLWVMETNQKNEVSVKKIEKSSIKKSELPQNTTLFFLGVGLFLVIIFLRNYILYGTMVKFK